MSLAQAGFRLVETGGPRLFCFYPTEAEESVQTVGPYSFPAASGAPAASLRQLLIVISHGTGSTPLVFRELGVRLARHGYPVVGVEHPGNNRNDNRLANTMAILEQRPRDIRRAIDWARAEWSVPERAVVIGHSLGGYTGLACAGGQGSFYTQPFSVEPDPRVIALVLLAPAASWFQSPGALDAVRVPVLMLTGDKDPHTPPFHARVVTSGLPKDTPMDHRVVANAGHFSFQDPFPEAMRSPAFPPSQDPEGFDRAAFQQQWHGWLLDFLKTFSEPPRPA